MLCVCITRSDDFRLRIYAAWARGAGDIGPPRRPEPTEELQLRVRVTGESAEGAGRGSRRDFGVIVCGTGVQCLPLALRDTRLLQPPSYSRGQASWSDDPVAKHVAFVAAAREQGPA